MRKDRFETQRQIGIQIDTKTSRPTDRHLFGEVGGGGGVDKGLQPGGVGGPLKVQAELHHHGDGSDLVSEVTVVLQRAATQHSYNYGITT